MAITSYSARTAQIALFSIFTSFGMMVGLWAAAIPQLQTRLNLSADLLGLSIFCFGLGAVLATFVVPKYIERHQTRTVMTFGGCAMWLVFPFALIAPTIATFMLLLAILGFFCGVLDTSMNSHAFTVEHHLNKPTLSLFHGGYSLGNVIGSGFAALILSLAISFHFSVFAVAMSAVIALVWAKNYCYPNDAQSTTNVTDVAISSKRVPFALIVVATLTGVSFFSEGAVGDWAGLFIRDEKSASPTQTALSIGAFASGMTVARFLGDRLRARYAVLPLLCASSALAAIMLMIFVFTPNATLALIALAIAGLGYANVVPLLFVRAANIEGVSPARGVSFAAGMGYASLLGGPALLGYLAEHFGLFNAMFLVVISAAILSFESGWQHRKSRVSSTD